MAAAAAAAEEELPLLIQDYSCANSFEEHVRMIEKYLAALFDAEPLLQSFLVAPSGAARTNTSSPLRLSSSGPSKSFSPASASGGGGGDEDDDGSDTSSSPSSLVSLLEDSTQHNRTALSRVFSHTMTLYAPPPSSTATSGADGAAQLDLELSVAVEVHVRDAAHLITQQYCTPLFFLLRKVAASAAYRESETTYLLSLLSTAVWQVLRQLKNRAVLRIGASTSPSGLAVPFTSSTTTNTSMMTPSLPSRCAKSAAEALPSPFFFPDGCAPCFVPAGDSYKQSFVGVAPPLPTMGGSMPSTPPPSASASSPAEMSTAEWNLLHQRTFTTRFLSDAFAHPPEHCRTLAEFIDLFLLHVGQHSRIRSDDFEGICVSLWKEYALQIPWKFHPHGPPPPDAATAGTRKSKSSSSKGGAATHETSTSAAASSLTWEAVLERENACTRLLSGAFTHPFGTTAPPLKHVLFRFQWNQLQDVEAQEPHGRGSHLNPFQFATAPSPSGPLSAAAQAAQRKCCITAQAVARNDEDVQGGVRQRLHEVVERNYFDSLPSLATRSPTSSEPGRPPRKGRTGEASNAGGVRGANDTEGSRQSPTTRSIRPGESGESGGESGDAGGGDAEGPPLHELAAHVVEWSGSNVNLQQSLLRRFASPCPEDRHGEGTLDNAPDDDDDEEGREGQTRRGVRAAAARRSGNGVARRLRTLWDEWEAHRQLFPIKSTNAKSEGSAEEQQRGTSVEDAECDAAAAAAKLKWEGRKQQHLEGGSGSSTTVASASAKDLRVHYFPESFFARFAYACATQLSHAEDVPVLWQLCLDRLKALLLVPSSSGSDATTSTDEEEKRSWRRLLDCLALPLSDPPVDLSQPLLSQKLQLLRFALDSLLHPAENICAADGVDRGAVAKTRDAYEETGEVPSPPAVLHLITNGEVLIAPAPLPTPPTTSDLVLQRAMQLNALGAAAVQSASATWLQGEALYNDMCVFLYVNKAQDGRVVRFPDFVQWHSPRDFVPPALPNVTGAATRSDSDYLSDRMKDQPDGGRGSSHVWWSLWRRAVPRSRDDVVRTLFQPLAEATRVLDWLAALPGTALLLEVGNACVANALHQLLCHRFLLGDTSTRDGGGRGGRALMSGASDCRHRSPLPASPRLRSLHRYVQAKCTSLTKDLEAASAILASSAVEAMELEMLRTFMANAVREVGDIEVCLCTAVAVHYLLGFTADAEAAATVRALCAPNISTQQPLRQQDALSTLQLRTVTVSRAVWATCFARQFVRPESHVVQESMVRLTCMAERPLNTCGCFQQLVVHQDAAHTMRMALALTKEVL
ncbi:hypothetical protein ABB37_05425 [Leptomonas pyrrhocoris]|uniref:Rab3 GTPase-activating protein catalytic subunit n=1 Tax=Leptomonas pyrrhocoris TaxID=157538 RepID=A0A0M9G0B0_LEPPY|nr:hypothetical protein ABB37_05425 [Leptomonas pyrrhocoris]KPA79633.1 hypothetical protein ABB37_05425 [Leptomonas pyrrhocoris]|eukprot:XP_015658072.1 hypothetical protein ABB37_05425 [Leptomonas pyrrhocoris]